SLSLSLFYPSPPSLSASPPFILHEMEVEEDVKIRKTCLICTTPITIPHYGIDACRACASFFKRAKLTGKKFVCRQGDKKCAVVKEERFTCRSCRYDRCVANGMVYELKVNDNINENEKKIPFYDAETVGPSTSRESQESILQRIGRLYNVSIDRRRHRELQLLQNRSDLKLAPHPTQKLYLGTYAVSLRIFDITHSETRQVYEKAFPAITKLAIEEQDTLCKSYISKFCLVDNVYRTRKMWGELTRFGMRSVLSTVDFNRFDLWLGEEKGGQNKQSLVSYLEAQIQVQFGFVVPIMERAQITDKEFHALLALLMCEIGSSRVLQGRNWTE
ncbi:hypothetical protein PFISCL1PPCAC_14335, partial [Pristionchus fissidentatus]